jgi:hypothetical protein
LVDFSLIPQSALKVQAWLPDGRGNSVGVLATGRTGRTTRVGLMMGSWSLFRTVTFDVPIRPPFGQCLEQEEVHIAYRDRTWTLKADE